MLDHDQLYRFLFEHSAVRGSIVHLDATWREVLKRHDYAPVVRQLLGQMMVSSTLLSSSLKFNGSLIMQVQGSGPLTLAVVECTSQRTLRGLAHCAVAPETDRLSDLAGKGYLAITLDPRDGGERYQGIVELGASNLADALDNYLQRSEQLDTRMWLVASDEGCAGMLLQRLPGVQETDADAWNRILHLAGTLSDAELLSLPVRELLHRLFHEDDVRLFDAEPVSFRCSCSSDKVRQTLRMLGRDEVRSIIAEQGRVDVRCEYCNQRYLFDPVDAEELFVAGPTSDPSSMRH